MTKEDMIRMAREANGEEAWSGGVEWTWKEIERFAKLIAAKERKICAEICDEAGDTFSAKVIRMRDNSEDNYPA
jgi:hypothetical protein